MGLTQQQIKEYYDAFEILQKHKAGLREPYLSFIEMIENELDVLEKN